MSTIKLEFESEDNAVVTAVAALTNSLLGLKASTGKPVESLKVADAEEVKVKTPTPRPSRAKPKPAPVEEETEEDEDFSDEEEETADDSEEEAITVDDLRALQATKIDKHRDALKTQYKKLGATGLSSLEPENYQKMYDFLAKLK